MKSVAARSGAEQGDEREQQGVPDIDPTAGAELGLGQRGEGEAGLLLELACHGLLGRFPLWQVQQTGGEWSADQSESHSWRT